MSLNTVLGFQLRATDYASSVLGGVQKSLGTLQKATDNIVESFGPKIGALMSRTALGLSAAGAGMGYGLHVALGEATAFGKGITEVSTLVPATQFALADMRREVFALSEQFGGDLGDQTKAMYQGISAGASDASANTALMTQANKLAIAGVTDVRTAVDGLTNVLNAYGQTYTEQHLVDVSDAFFAAIRGGKTTASELASTLGRLAPAASSAGVSIDEMLASVATITTRGLKTEEAITGLKAALSNIQKPSSDAAAEAQKLGVAFSADGLRKAGGFAPFLSQITKSAAFTANSMTALFGSVEAANAILALTSGGSAAFTGMLDGMTSKAGGTDAAFAKMAGTAAFQDSVLVAATQRAKVMIGEGLEPLHHALATVANAVVGAFTRLPAPMIRVLSLVAAGAAALSVLAGGALATAVAIGGLVSMGSALAVGLAAITVVAAPVVAGFGLMVAAGVGLKVAYERDIGGLATKLRRWGAQISLAFSGVTQLFESGAFSGSVMADLNKAENSGVKRFAINVFVIGERIKELFIGVGRGFSGAVEAAAPSFRAFVRSIENIASALGLASGDAPDVAKRKWQSMGAAGEVIGRGLGVAFDFAASALAGVALAGQRAVDTYKSMAPTLGATWSSVRQLGAAFGELNATIFGTSRSSSGWEILGSVIGTVAAGISTSVMVISAAMSMVIDTISGVTSSVKGAFLGVYNILSGIGKVALAIFSDGGDWGLAWRGAKQIVFGVAQAILGAVTGMFTQIAGIADRIGSALGKDLGIRKALREGSDAALVDLSNALDISVAGGAQARTLQGAPRRVGGQAEVAPFMGPTQANALPFVGPTMGGPAAASVAAIAPSVGAASASRAAPVDVTTRVNLTVDGRVLAETVTKYQRDSGAQGFGPTHSPT